MLVNSNPATIMTDPDIGRRDLYRADHAGNRHQSSSRSERPDAWLLPTMGGQTALNIAMTLADNGTLDRLGIEMIGANGRASKRPRIGSFSATRWRKIGLDCPKAASRTRGAAPGLG